MPATYMSYEIEAGDDADTIRKKLYAGIMSVGETAYTLGAAVAELRKQADILNKRADEIERAIRKLHKDFDEHKSKLTEAS